MSLEFQILPERNLVVFTVNDAMTLEEYFDAWERVFEHSQFTKGMNSLFDIRSGSLKHVTGPHIYSVTDNLARNIERRGENFKIALVVQDELNLGVARMFQTISRNLPCETRIFNDLDQALGFVSELQV